MSLETLPTLREALEAHGLWAKKAFGQHFLLDLNITRKIARLAQVGDGDVVIEVGPGPGGLTRALLETGARVIAVEKDERFRPLLQEVADAAPHLTLVFGDALTADEAALSAGRPAHLVSNLPYNVGTPLLIKWLTGPWTPASLTLMFQKEVADRITAAPGEDAYGRLAVIAQATADARPVMDVPARAFTPPPKVESAVVRLEPRAARPSPERLDALQKVTAAAFGQRRKMLRSSLKALGGEPLITAAGLDPAARAEVVPVAGFLALADAWLARREAPATAAPRGR
ncbi:dimethyladenosine transferase [Phenylobacterium zucineum HLK1]|uniref:Ribosomal RNA small subunit methyltransferase A n=1 Tax=Phenylobacterium zucineum (strain HLK1) TaxID=450851 RepID=RSMA_PHEZH|nr:16S rRNA (adenine(1518)-N(6)/adenine(1519)-N(6))-dimethyltransferase RsmA [Phenylobacterium zucineum]B4RBS4.1 RecName: Full=Ribosomal RNA small subunit methyltransferase A; AltName: Full=16S rRNA (adenine(1518)-N(6)/adenine(1519)-N(6))-dimethyltransferase; AltName: Full=16S rRNA dimethyladenosine transferase; AltName: Full=16S rRNA dimethylase; AltName: Full=S-adenosylmethionine-6-N', N'-adenosyl(rRNA) dimethyltransferase [Phenylobacterium zucineum HLK1]ACG78121.1 dimethyladenosine transferase